MSNIFDRHAKALENFLDVALNYLDLTRQKLPAVLEVFHEFEVQAPLLSTESLSRIFSFDYPILSGIQTQFLHEINQDKVRRQALHPTPAYLEAMSTLMMVNDFITLILDCFDLAVTIIYEREGPYPHTLDWIFDMAKEK